MPTAELQELDRYTDREPGRAIAGADARLQAPSGTRDLLLRAQLYAIVAEAQAEQSRPSEARAAIDAASRALDSAPASAAAQVVRARLVITGANVASGRAETEAAVRSLDALLATLPPDAIARSCALAIRAFAHSALEQSELAAADAVAAYQAATTGHWLEPRQHAAYLLASVYRHSGLLTQAQAMIDEVIAYANGEQRTELLATALYVRGQILIDARRYAEARESLARAETLAGGTGDTLGAAASRLATCAALLGEEDYEHAEPVCATGDAEFAAAHRADLAALIHVYRARVDLGRGQVPVALARLNQALGTDKAALPRSAAPAAYRARARALALLARYREANEDLVRAADAEQVLSDDERHRALVILSATAAYEKLVAANQVLQERDVRQREEIAHRELTQRLSIGLAAAALVVCALLGYLLMSSRRHSIALRRQETILRTTADCAPDALALLDERRHVRFANRNLFGAGPVHAVGTDLASSLPAAVVNRVTAALDELFNDRKPTTFSIDLRDPDGVVRQFELRGVPVVENGALVGATLRSIEVTDLRRLEREVIEVASQERQRLSSDLHEGLGQQLTGVSLLLMTLQTTLARGDQSWSKLVDDLKRHVNRTIEMTRDLARGMSPVQIERGSLADALQRLAMEAGQRLRVVVVANVQTPDEAISDAAADHIYRIVYETITNAARHSGCQRIEIELVDDVDALRLTITDDGSGFAASASPHDGLGLQMVAYRARLLGGALRVERRVPHGTHVIVTVAKSLLTRPDTAASTSHGAG